MNSNKVRLIDSIIIVLGSLLFMTGIGGVRLFDWDEINFAESARGMLVTGDWFNVQINYVSFWEKPPLFIWAQALSMKLFGVNEFAARFPNAVMGVVTLLTLFHCGLKSENLRFGILWAGLYAISFLPFIYFKSGIIDPWFNYFIFLGIYFFSRYDDTMQTRHAALSGLFTGLAVLTKGPVGFLIFALTFAGWLVFRGFRFGHCSGIFRGFGCGVRGNFGYGLFRSFLVLLSSLCGIVLFQGHACFLSRTTTRSLGLGTIGPLITGLLCHYCSPPSSADVSGPESGTGARNRDLSCRKNCLSVALLDTSMTAIRTTA